MRQPYWDLYEMAERKPPLWFDEEGVPRWVPFHPDLMNNIYADEAILFELECQSCGRWYCVALSYYRLEHIYTGGPERPSFSEQLKDPEWLPYWGDAPCFQGCDGEMVQCAGSTMTSETLRILEFWKHENGDWKKVSRKKWKTAK